MELKETIFNGIHVLRLVGGCELNDGKTILNSAKSMIDKEIYKIIFDCSELSYIDSSALGTLIGINKKLKKLGGKIVLASCESAVKEIFEITKVDMLFDFAENLVEATELLE